MRYVSLAFAALVLCGCAPAFYRPAEGTPTANVRFVATYSGNTEFIVSDSIDCATSGRSVVGWFHPMDTASAYRRGFDRREGMPGGDRYPSHMYSEMRVDAGKPFFIKVSSVAGGGAAPFSVDACAIKAELTVAPGREYEMVQVRDGRRCDVLFYELLRTPVGVERKPAELAAKRLCSGDPM